mmetsp:Transcript_24587/g.58988  ORF Transcript_24587/g.58988 Transcript_24587/m.58988 type:complete len:136 (+) Transcript_24587:166-573(+)
MQRLPGVAGLQTVQGRGMAAGRMPSSVWRGLHKRLTCAPFWVRGGDAGMSLCFCHRGDRQRGEDIFIAVEQPQAQGYVNERDSEGNVRLPSARDRGIGNEKAAVETSLVENIMARARRTSFVLGGIVQPRLLPTM